MRGNAKREVVSSGRLTGAVRGRVAASRPGAASRPEPAYSLYSTDSEDQVTTLQKGLDRCAALLHGMLQADKAASPSLPRTVSSGAVRSRLSSSVGKKALKKLPPKADHRSAPSGQRGPGTRTPRAHRSTPPAPHSGVKLHPPQKQLAQLQSHLLPAHSQTPQLLSPTAHPAQASTPPPQPEVSVLLSVRQSSSLSEQLPVHQAACQSVSQPSHTHCVRDEEEECVPVRDVNTQSPPTDSHTAARHTHAHRDTCTMKMSHLQLEPGRGETVPGDTLSREGCGAEADTTATMVQYLLGELKALIAGRGGVAESLLSDLEQAVSTPQMNVGRSQCVSDPSALHSHNTQLHRHGRILNQQLKESEKAERHQKQEILSNSESKVLRLQEELTAAQHQLQELREDLSDLWDTLRDAQSQLREREAENALMKTDLEATKSRLLHSEQERSKLASLAEHRLKQMGHLNSLLQSRLSSDCLTAAESSVSDTDQQQHRLEPLAPPTDHIIQYLKSLGQSVHTEDVQYVAAEREGAPISHHDVKGQGSEEPAGPRVNRQKSNLEAQRPEEARRQHSQCDTESVWSDWSMKSRLTFDTRDEAAFRDGLAALDASIASLQKTIELDLKS
ncbi:coiled-coil domain-containing protein 14 isoform X1 [Archocentrus centrarchus]|uniref:coiled-coil domain-containing protein 14 isoform X1 n=1 Tax=Archocentrus centrarchus TaxID=63155 RepID=UPI0011E9E566|nr:coiled-coil domain-containing protein 14 isoform X1 [Archocentrus centrarchus]